MHLSRYDSVKNDLKILIYKYKLRFFDNFCLATTENLHRAKLSYKRILLTLKLISLDYKTCTHIMTLKPARREHST